MVFGGILTVLTWAWPKYTVIVSTFLLALCLLHSAIMYNRIFVLKDVTFKQFFEEAFLPNVIILKHELPLLRYFSAIKPH
jgi:hypothetical protein